MKNILKNKIVTFGFLLALFSCNNKPADSAHAQDEHADVIVKLSAEQEKAIGIAVGEIVNRNLKTTLKLNGKLTLPPQNQANVSLPVGGIVKNILVAEGVYVKQGQTLVTIENAEFIQLQQDFLQTKTQLDYLKAEFERQKELQKENVNAAKVFQKAESDYKTEVTKYNALKQKLKLYNVHADNLTAENISNTFSVVAPINGNIHTISVNMGAYAEPNKQLLDIVDNHFLHIDLTVFEKDISKIHEGQKLTFTDANDPTHLHNAVIFSVNKAFEYGQQAVIAHAEILGVSETLLPGMFVEARVDIDNNTSPSIPSEAIVSNGNDHFIFIKQSDNIYKQIPVRTGTSDLNFTEVIPLQEIAPNQQVVVKGAYYLLSELTKGEGEHDH